ncbi:hypothetical protein D3C80_2064070 [compost metagenome]
MCFLSGTDGGSNRSDIERVGAEGGHQQRTKAGDGDDRVGTGAEAVITQHQHARHVLAGQGDQE